MKTKASSPTQSHQGPLSWQLLLRWLREDDVISAEVAERTAHRMASADSAQHPVQRLALLGLPRQADGKLLDAEDLTQ